MSGQNICTRSTDSQTVKNTKDNYKRYRKGLKKEDKAMQKHTSIVTLTSGQTGGSINVTVAGLST